MRAVTYVLVLELREHVDLAVHAARRGRARERVRHLLERHAASVARVRHRPANANTPMHVCTRAIRSSDTDLAMGTGFWHALSPLVCVTCGVLCHAPSATLAISQPALWMCMCYWLINLQRCARRHTWHTAADSEAEAEAKYSSVSTDAVASGRKALNVRDSALRSSCRETRSRCPSDASPLLSDRMRQVHGERVLEVEG